MSDIATPDHVTQSGLNGWVEAGIFAVALSVLNIAYAVAFQIGAHPVVFIGYAMIFASLMLLLITGPGPNWRQIVMHPLSFGIGGGIVLMEMTYYLLLNYVTPAEGSLLVRLNVPLAAAMGLLILGRRAPPVAILGHCVVLAAVFWYVPALREDSRTVAVVLGIACGFIMTARWFATEFHPWNRSARSIWEKMRLTGLVLLVTSVMSVLVAGGLMWFVANGTLAQPVWLPEPQQLTHLPTIAVAFFSGAIVITTMQYFGFSTVVKIRAENFLATTALIPLITVGFQVAAVALGVLAPIPLDWAVVPSMLAVFGGVLLVIWAASQEATP